MENQYVHPENGAEVRSQDIDGISENAGLADDRVLHELLRLTTGSATPQKVILPYGKSGWVKESGLTSTALVQGNASDGSVRVMPFRAIIGSTNTSDQLEKLRGQRSAVRVGSSTQQTTVVLAANATGNPRWTLVYAIVSPDANGDTANYVKKDPTTKVVSLVPAGLITLATTVTVSTVDGTAGASPTRPSLPADGAGSYNIALAYIWVPNGFNGSSAVARGTIYEVAPCVTIHSAMGVDALEPANHQHKIGGTVDTNQSVATTAIIQNGAYLPPTMVGGAKRFILLQLGTTPLSHNDGDVVDDSVDWRFRYFRWTIHYQSGSNGNVVFASDRNSTPSTPTMSTANTTNDSGCGQSFKDDNTQTVTYGSSNGTAVYFDFGAGDEIAIHVRSTDGALVFKVIGAPIRQVFIWLEASAPYSNYGTV